MSISNIPKEELAVAVQTLLNGEGKMPPAELNGKPEEAEISMEVTSDD